MISVFTLEATRGFRFLEWGLGRGGQRRDNRLAVGFEIRGRNAAIVDGAFVEQVI